MTFAHIYTPAGTTADDVIAQLVGQAREPGDCVVATDDRGERQAVEALGAGGISSADLASWIDRAENGSRRSWGSAAGTTSPNGGARARS